MTASSELDPVVARELSTQLALLAVERAAPNELLMFDEVAEEYFADPAAALSPEPRDEAVGFGLDLIILTPYVIAVAQVALSYLWEVLMSRKNNATPQDVLQILRHTLNFPIDEPSKRHPAQWGPKQIEQIFALASNEGESLGLSTGQAQLLAHAIVGVLTTEYI